MVRTRGLGREGNTKYGSRCFFIRDGHDRGALQLTLALIDRLFTLPRYKAFTGKIPFNSHTSLMAVVAIMNGERPPRPTHLALTDELWELIQRCWNEDRDERPRMLEVLQTLNPPPPSRTPSRVFSRPQEPNHSDAEFQLVLREVEPPRGLTTPYEENSVPNIWRRIGRLDLSNEEYRPLLHTFLSHQDLKSHIQGLQGPGLQGFVELLDNVGRVDTKSTSADFAQLGTQPHPGHR